MEEETVSKEIPPSKVQTMEGHTKKVFSCCWNPRSSVLATGFTLFSSVPIDPLIQLCISGTFFLLRRTEPTRWRRSQEPFSLTPFLPMERTLSPVSHGTYECRFSTP